MKKYLIALSCLMLSMVVNGSEKDHNHSKHGSSEKKVKHSAHEHGVAEMNLALLGREVQIEISTPSFNLLGFEHEPNTADQKATLSRAEKAMKAPSTLFTFEGAKCAVEHVSIKSPFEQEGHGDEHKHEDEHKHKENKKAAHAHKSEDNKAEADESSHSEYMLIYHFECESSEENLKINASGLFSNFPNFSTIRTQWLSDKKQGSAKLTSKNSQLSIK